MIQVLFVILLIFFAISYVISDETYGSSNSTYFYLLPYNFDWDHYSATAPWYSALAQAEALPLLIQAYNMTGLEIYKSSSDGILNSFFVDVRDGGVTHKDDDGWWFELYSDRGSNNSKVLNGMLWTLLAIKQYENITGDSRAKLLFDHGIESLKSNLYKYDAENQTYYDIFKKPADFNYHNIHVKLLAQLYNITGEKSFLMMSEKWSKISVKKPSENYGPTIYLDEYYIPYVDYGDVEGSYVGIQRNPLTVDHVARDYYAKYIEFKDPFFKNAFLSNVNWLVSNIKNFTN